MMIDLLFIFNSILLGVGLAMDAFSVSIGNGLAEPDMKHGRMSLMAGCYAFFQFAMPMIGWVFVHTAESKLEWFSDLVPWIALLLLLYIGGKMLKEGSPVRYNMPANLANGCVGYVPIRELFVPGVYEARLCSSSQLISSCTSSTRAPPSVPPSAACPPPSGKNAVRSRTTAQRSPSFSQEITFAENARR